MSKFSSSPKKILPPPTATSVDGSSEQKLVEAFLDAIKTRVERRDAGPFLPLELPPGSTLERIDQALNEVRATIPDSEHVYFDTSRDRYQAILSLVVPRLKSESRILDVGCAPGHNSMALYGLGHTDIHGIDLNDLYLPKYPTPQWVERLKITALDIENNALPFEDESFDLVIFSEILEHIAIKDPKKILAELKRVLRPGGQFMLTVPNMASVGQILALASLQNVMWAPEMFYGSTDRHNREYAPHEVVDLIDGVFDGADYYLMNAEHNWHGDAVDEVREMCRGAAQVTNHPIFYNTLMAHASRALTNK